MHPSVTQLIGAQAELCQGRVDTERRADVLAPHLSEATVIQPVDGTPGSHGVEPASGPKIISCHRLRAISGQEVKR